MAQTADNYTNNPLIHRDRRLNSSPSKWVSSFYCGELKPLIVCRGPIRKEAMDVYAEMGITHFGILLSEKDSIIYPNALAPELRTLHRSDWGFVHQDPRQNLRMGVSAGGYKGMFVRWAAMFIHRYHVPGYDAWLARNAAAAAGHANATGLMDQNWTAQTGAGPLAAFSCSSAVVLLQWAAAGAAG